MRWIFNTEDIFVECPNDSENMLMNIPPEVCAAANLNPNDTLRIKATENGKIVLTKVNRGKHED